MRTVFYSWQSDLPNSTNRGFIEVCIERALHEMAAEDGVKVFMPDRDTQGETGSPDIADTIFDKIDQCSAFVADVSFINNARHEVDDDVPPAEGCKCTRKTPNPNVMGEWGRATKSVDFDRIICVLNEATGTVEELPFDLRKRSVVTYNLVKDQDKSDARRALIGQLKSKLKAILDLPLAIVDLQFVDATSRRGLGKAIEVSNIFLSIPHDQIPLLKDRQSGGIGAVYVSGLHGVNPKYFRQMANYLMMRNLLRPIAVCLTNTGGKLLRNVRLVATIAEPTDGVILQESLPKAPSRERSYELSANLMMSKIHSGRPYPGRVEIELRGNTYSVEVGFENVQAKDTVVSKSFYIGAVARAVVITGLVYADELSAPIPISLGVQFGTAKNEMSVAELTAIDENAT